MGSVDLTNCASEPIHIPGAIQPHGALLVCRLGSLQVSAVSSNALDILGRSPSDLLGHSLSALFDEASQASLMGAAGLPVLRVVNPLRVTSHGARSFEAVLHHPPNDPTLLVIELEPASFEPQSGGPVFDPRLRTAILRLQGAHDRRSLNQIAAEEVRALTGFDRVMVYEFDADWNGAVVAETRREDLDSFLGQHYPASDIPAQARRLYELNWLRLIADVSYEPAPLIGLNSDKPLDMSYAVLRSVSPIHIEYLKNMAVSASLSISLLREGKLVGLIACHHYSGPRILPFAIRETSEYLGQALSWHGDVLRMAALADDARRVHEHEADIVRSVANHAELLDGLAQDSLVLIAGARGAAVVLGEGMRCVGVTPTPERIAVIVQFLKNLAEDVFRTDRLAAHLPEAAAWDDVAAGLLAVAIAPEVGEYLLWFRPSTERTIDWAGNPHHVKLTHSDGVPPRLSPRGSFALWRETVRGRATPWQSWEVEGASSLRRLLLGGIRRRATELRVLNQRLLEADRAKDNFIATVSHELRTPLSSMSGWANLLRSGDVPEDKVSHALDVIVRNVQMQSQLIEDLLDVSRMASGKLTLEVESVELPFVVKAAIENAALAAEARSIRLTSVLDPLAAPVLGDPGRLRQVVSNLLGNAIKFTASGGSVNVTLRRLSSEVELSIADTGRGIAPEFLPYLFEAFRQQDAGMNRRSNGLGLGLAIVKKLVELHGGTVTALSEGVGQGSVFQVRLPMAALQIRQVEDTVAPSPTPAPANELDGLHILIVEDDPDSRDLLQHVLQRRGAVVTSAGDAAMALALLEHSAPFDLLISDVGLPDIDGMAFIRLLRQRPAARGGRLPAVALTAYSRAADRTRALQAGFQTHLAKPVDADELVAVLMSLLERH